MAADDRRIAWLLPLPALEGGSAPTRAHLSLAAEAGFSAVAIEPSTPTGGIEQDIEAEATRLGMRCILVDDAAHCRLASVLGGAERRAMARSLSRAGFDGLVLCESRDGRTSPGALLATAAALLRDLDQIDWEAYH